MGLELHGGKKSAYSLAGYALLAAIVLAETGQALCGSGTLFVFVFVIIIERFCVNPESFHSS
jgi:hypothetical protein